jgi:hypothetical protein
MKHFGEETLHQIQKLTSLSEIFLFSSKIRHSAQFFESVSSLPYLTHLELSDVEGLKSSDFGKLTKLKTLTSLSLENLSMINKQCIQDIAKLTTLQLLELIQCKDFNEKSFKYLTSLQRLHTIRIYLFEQKKISSCTVCSLCHVLCQIPKLCHITIPFSPKSQPQDFLCLTQLRFLQKLCIFQCPPEFLETLANTRTNIPFQICSIQTFQQK